MIAVLHTLILLLAGAVASFGLGLPWLLAVLLLFMGLSVAVGGLEDHHRRTVVFLGSVAMVVVGGLAAGGSNLVSLLFAAILVVLYVAWASALWGMDRARKASSLLFYGALSLAFFLLVGVPDNWPSHLRFIGAMVSLAIGILLWRSMLPLKRFRSVDQDEDSDAQGALPRWASGLAALLILGALLAALFIKPLPWLGDQAMAAGTKIREGLPLVDWFVGKSGDEDSSTEVEAPPMENFGRRRDLPERAELELGSQAVMHVRIDDPLAFRKFVAERNYVRSWVLERYSENGWEEPPADPAIYEDASDGQLDGWVRFRNQPGLRHEIYLPAAGGLGLPAIQNPVGYGLDFVVQSAPDMYEAELRGAVRYEAESRSLIWERLTRRNYRPRVAARAHLLERPRGSLGRRVQVMTAGLTAGARNSDAQLTKIRDFLRNNCSYSQRIENPDGLPPMENFLFGERVGWCDFFASAAALMAREAGFPSRMAYGYSGGIAFPEQGIISYREEDAHAWAEVLIDGVGWVVFDTSPEGSGAARLPGAGGGLAPPDLSSYRDADADRGQNKEVKPERERWDLSGVLRWVFLGLMVLVVATAAMRIFRSRSSGEEPDAVGDDDANERHAPPYLREFLRLCREFGRPKPEGDTLREAIAMLEGAGLSSPRFSELADYHYGIRYRDAQRDRGQESSLRRALRTLRKRLKKDASPTAT